MAGVICRRAATTVAGARAVRRFGSLTAPRFPQAATTTASALPPGQSLRPVAALTSPRLPTGQSRRPFAALTSPRLPAAAAARASSLGRPSASAAALRHTHQAATAEQMQALESRVQRLELDFDSKTLRVETVLRKEIGEVHDKFLKEKATQNDRISNLGQVVFAEGRRSVHRASISSAENQRAINQVGKVSWRVVVTVVTGAATTAFAVAQLLRADTKAEQTEVAEKIIATRIAELQTEFTTNLAATVESAVGVAMAKEARRKTSSEEDALQAFNSRLDDVFSALDERIAKAVEAAMIKQAATNNNKSDGKGGRGT